MNTHRPLLIRSPDSWPCAPCRSVRRRGAVRASAGWRFARTLSLLALCPAWPAAQAASAVQFNRDIRPVLSENCFACHGPDAHARKAGLRFDTKEGIFERTPKHDPAVVPGHLDQSELWRRINATDPDEVMPPPKSRKVLKPGQKELLRKWILAGAPWQGHWAYIKPERPRVPMLRESVFSRSGFSTSVSNGVGSDPRATGSLNTDSRGTDAWIRNPIDAFVLARLQSQGLHPAPEADPRTLARRLSFDLTGLPPKPQVVEAFLRDDASDAYDRLVKHFLSFPHWGEHRARYWLDAARYADTHGLHFDNYREMWPYRDWVIKAFNSNLPFDRFTLYQLAGDLFSP